MLDTSATYDNDSNNITVGGPHVVHCIVDTSATCDNDNDTIGGQHVILFYSQAKYNLKLLTFKFIHFIK